MRYILIWLTLLPCISIAQKRSLVGIQAAEYQVEMAKKKTDYPVNVKSIIDDKETATAIAELVLFKIYGKKSIISQRPYEIYLIDDCWFIRGTLPAAKTAGGITTEVVGGTFLIILSSKDGRIIKLDHGE
ncbi:MAG TPA: NTF2 fold immunity protein [Mucilaginibacter sp.]|jgi:hypothetical protein